MLQRVDKLLVSQGLGSRKEVTKLVRDGRVRVNGVPVKDSAQKADPEKDEVTLDGERLLYREHLYIMMNKPAGVLSATEDSRQKTVLDLLPEELTRRGLFPAGRLDKDTTGLLIITDDGDFAHRMLAPKSHVYKRYRAVLARSVTQSDIEAFAAGIEDGGERFAPARLAADESAPEPAAFVEVREGKFHQVKRMFAATDNRVLTLERLRIGGLTLDPALKPGEVRLLDAEEVGRIFSQFDQKNAQKRDV